MDSPCFQGSSFQLADSRLVSTPTRNSANAPSSLTQQQHEAIGVLKDEDDRNIFAWLDLARSLEPRLQHCSDHASLTRDQVHAIAALRDCKNSDISAWLRLARTPNGFGTLTITASPLVHDWPLNQGHSAPSILSDASIPSPFNPSSDHAPNHQSATQSSSTQPFSTATIPPSQAKPKYCCTLCDYSRPFKNQSDWKKHEREHDTKYICMLEGPREATPLGTQCAFCWVLNPHDDHLLDHNAQACLPGPPQSFSTKRRHEMVNHLGKIHGIHPKSQGEAIAVKWKYTVKKQAWSCGFCGNAFVSFNDRLSHISTQHFERGQTMDDWDATKVIQGLLQQSSMTQAWAEKLASLPAWEAPDIMWERNAIVDLQHDLEIGPNEEKSALNLAEAAYIACRMDWGMKTQPGMAFVATSSTSNRFDAPMASAPKFGSNQYRSLSAVQGINENSPSGPAFQATPLVNYDFSNAPMADFNDSNSTGLAASSFYYQPTQPVSRDQGNYNNGYGDLGNDKEESEFWPRTPGSIHETEFDAMFK